MQQDLACERRSENFNDGLGLEKGALMQLGMMGS